MLKMSIKDRKRKASTMCYFKHQNMNPFEYKDIILYTPYSLPSTKWYIGEYLKSETNSDGTVHYQIKSKEGTFWYPSDQVKPHPLCKMWNYGDLVEVSLDGIVWMPAIFKKNDNEYFNLDEELELTTIPYRVMGKEITKYEHIHNYRYGLWFPYCRDRK